MVRTANSCSHCTTVMGEYAFINTLMGPSVLLLHSEIGSVLWFSAIPGLFLYVMPPP